jgi:hypothetical protein
VLSLLALRSGRTPVQSVIWIGSGLLALVGTFFSFSGLTMTLLPLPGLLLLVGGAMAFTKPEVEKSVRVTAAALVLAFAGSTAFYVLFTQENPACWNLVHAESGENVWESSPPGFSPQVILEDPETGDVVA